MTVKLLTVVTVLFFGLVVERSFSIRVIESFPKRSWYGKAEVNVKLEVRKKRFSCLLCILKLIPSITTRSAFV